MDSPELSVKGILYCFLIALILFSNSVVIAAFWINPRLQTITNYWIVSLSLTDISLAVLVLPFQISMTSWQGQWTLGTDICNLYLVLDVLCCTCSIYHLALISVDRFLCVRFPIRYPAVRTHGVTILGIVATWLACALIGSVRMLFPVELRNESTWTVDMRCQMRSSVYMVFSSVLSFYLPLVVIVVMYLHVYFITREQTAKVIGNVLLSAAPVSQVNSQSIGGDSNLSAGPSRGQSVFDYVRRRHSSLFTWKQHTAVPMLVVTSPDGVPHPVLFRPKANSFSAVRTEQSASMNNIFEQDGYLCPPSSFPCPPDCENTQEGRLEDYLPLGPVPNSRRASSVQSSLQQSRQRQERRAARVVFIIVTFVIVFWTPFFVINSIKGICGGCVSDAVFDAVTLIGYFNSGMNPFVYTFFNRSFRATVIRMMKCKKPKRHGTLK